MSFKVGIRDENTMRERDLLFCFPGLRGTMKSLGGIRDKNTMRDTGYTSL